MESKGRLFANELVKEAVETHREDQLPKLILLLLFVERRSLQECLQLLIAGYLLELGLLLLLFFFSARCPDLLE